MVFGAVRMREPWKFGSDAILDRGRTGGEADSADPGCAGRAIQNRQPRSKPRGRIHRNPSIEAAGSKTMELKQLEVLVAVIEEGSVDKAAERIRRAEPALSTAIRQLEQEVGTALIEFSPVCRCLPTAAGELLYHHARGLLSQGGEAGLEYSDLGKVEFWNWPPML